MILKHLKIKITHDFELTFSRKILIDIYKYVIIFCCPTIQIGELNWISILFGFLFYGISIFNGYLMPNSFLSKKLVELLCNPLTGGGGGS